MNYLLESGNNLESDQDYSLTVICAAGRVLFGQKTRGYGANHWVCPGGRERLYEDRASNAVREVNEETGLLLSRAALHYVGVLQIMDLDEMEDITVHITKAELPQPVAVADTDELERLHWFPDYDLPYEQMPYDYRLWLPSIINSHLVQLNLETVGGVVVGGFGYERNVDPTIRGKVISVVPEVVT